MNGPQQYTIPGHIARVELSSHLFRVVFSFSGIRNTQQELEQTAEALRKEAEDQAKQVSQDIEASAKSITADVDGKISAVNKTITDEITSVNEALDSGLAQANKGVQEAKSAVADANKQIATVNKSLTDSITQVRQSVTDTAAEINATIDLEIARVSKTLADGDAALNAQIKTAENGLKQSLSQVNTTLTNAVKQETADRIADVNAKASQAADELLAATQGIEASIESLTQVMKTADENLAREMSSLAAGANIQFDSQVIWHFNNQTTEGWTGSAGVPGVSQDGWLRPADSATDPYITSPGGLAVDGAAYRFIMLRFRKTGKPVWAGEIRWVSAGENFNNTKRYIVAEPEYADGVATLTVRDIPWTGNIDRIRLDLTNQQDASNFIEFDWIAVTTITLAPGARVFDDTGAIFVNGVQVAWGNASWNTVSFELKTGWNTVDFLVNQWTGQAYINLGLKVSDKVAEMYSGLGVSALANAAGVLSSNLSQIGNDVVSNSQSITQLRNALTQTDANVASKADQTAMNSLTGRVEKTESGLTAANANITSLKSAVRAGNASGGDLIPNPTFDPAYDQMGFSVVATTAEEVPPGCPYGYAARIASRDHHPNFAAFPATLNDVIEISALVACGAGTANFNLYVGTAVRPDTSTGAPLMAGGGKSPSATWQRTTWRFKVTQAMVDRGYIRPFLQISQNSPYGTVWFVTDWHMRNVTAAQKVQDTADATAAAVDSLTTTVTQQGNLLTSTGNRTTQLENGLATTNAAVAKKADATAVQDLTNTVTQLGNDLTAANSAITKLTGNLANTDKALAQKADATALATLDTKVTQQGKTLESQSNSLTNLSNSLSQVAADIDASGQIPGNQTTLPGGLSAGGNIDNTSKGKVLTQAIELSMSTPYIDFHYNGSSADYTARLIHDRQNRLNAQVQSFWVTDGRITASSTMPANPAIGTQLTSNPVRSLMAGRGAYGDVDGAYVQMYMEEQVGTEHRLVLYADGFGRTDAWIFRAGGTISTGKGDVLTTGSDVRLKDAFMEPQEGASRRINSLGVCEFNMKGETRRRRGFIAQQAEKVDDLYTFLGIEQEIDGEKFRVMNVDYTAIIADLVTVVQDLIRRVDALES